MSKTEEQLEQLPEALRDKVNEYLTEREGSHILAVKAEGRYPKVYLQWGYMLMILGYIQDAETITHGSLTIKDVEVILQHCDWFRNEKASGGNQRP